MFCYLFSWIKNFVFIFFISKNRDEVLKTSLTELYLSDAIYFQNSL